MHPYIVPRFCTLLLCCLTLLCLPGLALTAEEAGTSSEGVPLLGVVGGIVAAIVAALSAWLTPWLTKLFKAKADQAKASQQHAELSRRGLLMARLEEFLYNSASHLAAKELPKIAALIAAGKVNDAKAIKLQLRGLGDRLKQRAIEKFAVEGIDLVAEFGTDVIEDLIDRMAAKVNFPGRDTVATLLKDGVADKVVSNGLSWTRSYLEVLEEDPEGATYAAIEDSPPRPENRLLQ